MENNKKKHKMSRRPTKKKNYYPKHVVKMQRTKDNYIEQKKTHESTIKKTRNENKTENQLRTFPQ